MQVITSWGGIGGPATEGEFTPAEAAILLRAALLCVHSFAKRLPTERGRHAGKWRPRHWPGKFNISHGVAIDACSRVWVADRANERLQVFDLAGKVRAARAAGGV